MAVEIEWIDSISPQATGNKIYRDTVPSTGEVEIADIANGVQFYSDGTVAAGTEYKFEVQAHDGAGDETTQEVEGDNMDYITTAGAEIDVYPQNNAASTSDQNTTTDWSASFTTLTTGQPGNGSNNAIKGVVTAAFAFQRSNDIPVENGATYKVYWDSLFVENNPGTSNAETTSWIGVVTTPTVNMTGDSTWTSHEVEVVTNATLMGVRFDGGWSGTSNTGDELWIDNIRVIKQ